MAATDNHSIEVRRSAGALGAEITGVDIAGGLDNATFDRIFQAFLDHQVVFIRDQMLDEDQFKAFGRRFGELVPYVFGGGLPDHPEILQILKTETETKNFGGGWHSDGAYLETPPLGTMLFCHEAPDHGGDTQYASGYAAYEALSNGLKRTLDGMVGINSAELKHSGGRARSASSYKNMNLADLDRAPAIVAEHPVIRIHPATGRKSVYVNPAHTVAFKGWTEEESKPLIRYLSDLATRPEHTSRMAWRPGTIGLWDNRCTQHFAINDYHGHRRRMWRLTIGPERTV